MPTPSALSLLRDPFHEPLGHRLSLPHVPRLCECMFEFSANGGGTQDQRQLDSDGSPDGNLKFEIVARAHYPTLFNFGFPQHHPYPYDRPPARPARQARSRCCGVWGRDRWIVQDHRYHAHRVLCPFRCELLARRWISGYRKRRGLKSGPSYPH